VFPKTFAEICSNHQIIIMGSIIIRKRLFSFFITFISLACAAQDPAVSGRVFDTAKQPVAFANVVLKKVLQDSTYMRTSFTGEDGRFEIAGSKEGGEFTLTISTVGFENYSTTLQVTGNVTVPDIILKTATKELEGVAIDQKRPVVRRKIDRLEFDVENSILSSENAWEIVKKTPGVTAMGDGLAIRGSSGILVTINDKKVYLTGTELKNLLENTDGSNIKSIEVITTPPAKYEAQGSAVLNIKMKKNIGGGYKGMATGAYVQSMYPKGVVATNHYYKGKKLTVFGGYMFGSGHYYGESKGEVKYFDTGGDVSSTWKSMEKSHYRAQQQNSYNITAEYAIDSMNTVSAGFNGFSSLKSTALVDTPTYIYGPARQLDSLFTSHNHRDYPEKNSTFTGSFEHKFNAKHKLSLSSDYTQYYTNQDQGITTDFSLPNEAPYRSQEIQSDDTRRIGLLSVQADYNGEIGQTKIEGGMRYGTVDAENNFDYYSEINDVPITGDLSNRFLYDESIVAGYVGADREFGKWGFKAGLRGEHTKLEGNLETTGEVNGQDYFKLFPSAYALYKASDNHQIGFSYGKRIIRPQYGMLNPFRSYSTPYSYSTGNPQLQPVMAHNFGLNYTLKGKYMFGLFYRYEKDPFSMITYQDYETTTIITEYTNISSNTSAGAEFNTNLALYPWWEAGTFMTLGYQENSFTGADGNLQEIDRWTFYGNTNNRFTLNKKKDLFAELSFFYASPTVQGAYKLGDISSLSVSFRKRFWDGNGELSLIFSDIYKGERQTTTTSYANQYSRYKTYGDSQSFRIQFRYRFGNQKLQDGQTRQTNEEQNRL
jgi:hypothetical protein